MKLGRPSRVGVVLVLLTLMLVGELSATAGSAQPGPISATSWSSVLAEQRLNADRLKQTLLGAGLQETVNAAWQMSNQPARTPMQSTRLAPEAPVPSGTSLRSMIRRLDQAVAKAVAMVGPNATSDTADSDPLEPLVPPLARCVQPAGLDLPCLGQVVDMPVSPAKNPRGVAALRRGSQLLSSALDHAVEWGTRRKLEPHSGRTVAGCDIIDQVPDLCVGGPGANTYKEDVALLVDVGGDDVYLNAPGRADAADDLPVSVSLDLAGDDRYAPKTANTERDLGPATARGQAIGFLVDVTGNDTYEVGTDTTRKQAVGLGVGVEGFAMLADLVGNDAYSVVGPTSIGAGIGLDSGVGIMSDGAGDDHYLVSGEVGPSRASRHQQSVTYGFGAGAVTGTGVFVEGAGDDVLLLESAARARHRKHKASATQVGFGTGFAGVGVAIFGLGDTKRTATTAVSSTRGKAAATSLVFGSGTAALGILLDEGGSDQTRSRVSLEGEAPTTLAGGMGLGLAGAGLLIDNEGSDIYDAAIDAPVPVGKGGGQALFQAAGFLFGAGALYDTGGKDIYRAAFAAGGVSAQASVDLGVARLVDLDHAEGDTFLVTPVDLPCEGTRGGDFWKDCGEIDGEGRAINY